jgi:mono/diheme cytochrome c family protein
MTAQVQDPVQQARAGVRRQARVLVRDPQNISAHLARLHASLDLPGSEPVQGALADMFVVLGVHEAALKRMGLQMAASRMAPHAARWFEAQVSAAPLSRITPLATRWSVLARPSADISTRARRCSVDDSRAQADAVLQAVAAGDLPAQQAFLHHCVTCHDNLAFMLARRALLRTGVTLPEDWAAVSLQLEQQPGS